MVQRKTWQLTGLSRDGVFLVEKGKVTDPVTNFRWNENPAEVLPRAVALSRPVRVTVDETGSQMAPAVVTADFHFASVSGAV
ncbi:MAG: metallopeptidase TldD-related protein [Acidobacteriota bacterium]|nr:metallopeptidase TldD-related protein [Acidobacteriota bacterium]